MVLWGVARGGAVLLRDAGRRHTSETGIAGIAGGGIGPLLGSPVALALQGHCSRMRALIWPPCASAPPSTPELPLSPPALPCCTPSASSPLSLPHFRHNAYRFITASLAQQTPPIAPAAHQSGSSGHTAPSLTQRVQSIALSLGLDPSLPLKALVGRAYMDLFGMGGVGSLVDQVNEIEKVLDGEVTALCSSSA